MNTPIRHIAAANQATLSENIRFREGSLVFVRVLERTPAGKFVVSFGGNRFLASAETKVAHGDEFLARIAVRNGKLHLVPVRDAFSPASVSADADTSNGVQRFLTETLSTQTQEQLSAFLQSLGLPPDSVSLSVVRFLQQFGFKFDVALVGKARRIAKQFSGREGDAAEAALYLLEKGLEPDAESVQELLFLLSGDGQPPHGGEQPAADTNHDDSGDTEDDETDDVFFRKIYAEGVVPENAEAGLLTLANQIVSSNRHWITLPFMIPENTADSSGQSHGILRFLLNVSQKTTEKAEISLQFFSRKWYFSISNFRQRIGEIVFYSDPPLSDSPEIAAKMLADCLHLRAESITYSREALSVGLFCGNDPLARVSAEA